VTGPEITYRLWLRPGRERSVTRRHPWLYSGAIDRIEARAGAPPGGLGEIVDARGEMLAVATVNPDAPLVARILRFGPGAIDEAYFAAALARADALRQAVLPARTTAYRRINAEGDGLPGLIVDRYGEFLVVQCLTLGMSRLEPLWLPALIAAGPTRGLIERSERASRDPDLSRPGAWRWRKGDIGFWSTSREGRRPVSTSISARTGGRSGNSPRDGAC
jgi:23S rRNA (cytosine1962-C5)-methyltransferase